MRILEIITIDSPKAAILRRRAKAVRTISPRIQQLIDAMVETMRAYHGLGLAAPQVGEGVRVIVVEVGDRLLALVDPEIVAAEGEEVGEEGCLSIPGIVAEVKRATKVRVRALNRRGKRVTVDAVGLLARVLQHEIDHLDGILITDRVEDPSKIRVIAEPVQALS
ncbi:MAG: peptide deformylase [Armatimonadota bacterium]|nr:peptide deformylase [Armatimonadota bacterium]MDR5703556.1 peptide deformylase [Armatimonadota bacterium]MDR7434955.1 peptide deformylase [Armatimonadota bacterium]